MKKLLCLLTTLLLLVSFTACSGNTSDFSTKVGNEKYKIIINEENGHKITRTYGDEEKFCIYKDGLLLAEDGIVTSGFSTSMAAELIKLESAEKTLSKNDAVFYAFQQYRNNDVPKDAYTIIVKFNSKPSYLLFEMEGTLQDVESLFAVMSVK